jgi:tellurite resistance protein
MTEYTEDEGQTFRTAVFGAMVLVSTADPGALDQESHAGAKAMAHLSPELREVLKAGRPRLPAGSVSDVENGVLDALRRSVEILAAKAPAEADAFPAAVLAICREVAEADGQVADAEGAVVAKVEAALTR